MALFEIHQRFKGHFLNELSVSFKHIPTLNLKDVKTTLGDNKMFTDIKSLITERNSQMPSQRRKMLNRLKDFDDNF